VSNVFAVTQRAFRFYEDGTESGSTAIAAEDANIDRTVISDSNLLLRVGLAETGAGSISGATTDDYQLQYELNDSASWVNVTSSSAVVRGFASSNLTDAGTTTNRLSAGGGSFVAGEISEVGLVTDRQLTANNHTEMLYALTIESADVAQNDTIDFRVLLNGSVMTYSVTPRITVNKNVTVGITGESSTLSVGTLGVAVAVALTGAAATCEAGTVRLAFDNTRQAIIDGFDSAQSEANGWDAKRSTIPLTAVVRTSDTVVTITLPAIGTYDITATETITGTIPAVALAGAESIGATPTITITTSGGGGDVTDDITGVSSTAEVGSLTPSTTVALTGESSTVAVGTVVPSSSVAITGEAATGAVDSVGAEGGDAEPVELSGVSSTGSAGSVTPSLSVALVGEAATGSAGDLGKTIAVPISGEAATGSAGTLGAEGGDVQAALSGVSASDAVGTLAPETSPAVSGNESIAGAGSVTPSITVPLTGASSTCSVGSVGAPSEMPDITVHTVGLGIYASAAAGTTQESATVGLGSYASPSAGIVVLQEVVTGTSYATPSAGVDAMQDVTAGLSDAV
jgi:hypothetical protein